MSVPPTIVYRRHDAPHHDVITDTSPPLTPSGALLIAASSVMVALTTCWSAFRIWARSITKMSFLIEDYLYFAAQLFFYGTATCYVLGVVLGGTGHDFWNLNELHKYRYFRIASATQVLYAATLGSVKLSITWMLQRIFFGHSTTYRVLAWVAMGLSVCWAVYASLISFVICKPAPKPENMTCGNFTMAFSASSIFDIITEVFIVMLPIELLAHLQVPLAHKIALCGVFCAGIITIVFSCLRFYIMANANFANGTKTTAVAGLAGVMQAGVALMVASSPMLRPVFDRTVGRVLGLSYHSQRHNTGGTSTVTGGATGDSTIGRHIKHARRSDGFNQMTDSEEHLAWELRNVTAPRGRDSGNLGATMATVDAIQHPDDGVIRGGGERDGPRGQEILVTKNHRCEPLDGRPGDKRSWSRPFIMLRAMGTRDIGTC